MPTRCASTYLENRQFNYLGCILKESKVTYIDVKDVNRARRYLPRYVVMISQLHNVFLHWENIQSQDNVFLHWENIQSQDTRISLDGGYFPTFLYPYLMVSGPVNRQPRPHTADRFTAVIFRSRSRTRLVGLLPKGFKLLVL